MTQTIRILLHGFINMNVMDGSAVFMNGLTKMLSLNENIQVDLLLATPIKRKILLSDLDAIPNVQIISPFDDRQVARLKLDGIERGRLQYEEAAAIINHYWQQKEYDWLIIRGIEVVDPLFELQPKILEKTFNYMTGITNKHQLLSPEKFKFYEKVLKISRYILCQTKQMKVFLLKKFPQLLNDDKVITLNPMIPNTANHFEQIFHKKSDYTTLCYVGKFHKDWNLIPMINGFKEIRYQHPRVTFHIVGDKFTNHPEIPHYNEDLTYLLQQTEGVHWKGAMQREDARQIITLADIGITWRTEKMNESLELSTKLLEYGSIGKAVIMNRTTMHEEIFGKNYPLYANSQEQFEEVLLKAITSPDVYEHAAQIMFEACKPFTFTETLQKLTPVLFAKNSSE